MNTFTVRYVCIPEWHADRVKRVKIRSLSFLLYFISVRFMHTIKTIKFLSIISSYAIH